MWAKFDCVDGQAYAQKTLSLPEDGFWFQADVYIPACTLIALADRSFSASAGVANVLDSDLDALDGISGNDNDDPPNWIWETAFLEGPALVTDTSHTVKVHYVNNDTTEWFLDGSSLGTDTAFDDPAAIIAIGGLFAAGLECEWYFVTNVKVGTTDGGTDIFADDFSSGDFSNWDSTTGDATIVSAPSGDCTPAPPLVITASPASVCFGAEVTVTGSGFTPDSPLTAILVNDAYDDETAPILDWDAPETDGDGAFTATFVFPLGGGDVIQVTDGDNVATFTLEVCCLTRHGDEVTSVTQLGPDLLDASAANALHYIHHDGAHWAVFATDPTTSGEDFSSFPPDTSYAALTVTRTPDDGSEVTTLPVFFDISYIFGDQGPIDTGGDTWFLVPFFFNLWQSLIYDAKFASDGENLWLSVLGAKTDVYPYLSNDEAQDGNPTQEAQFIDLATLIATYGYWTASGPGTDSPVGYQRWTRTEFNGVSCQENAPYSDGGDSWSGYWNTGRLRVFLVANDASAATDIGHLDTHYLPGNVTSGPYSECGSTQYNAKRTSGVLSGLAVAASPTDPGVLHLVYCEGGAYGRYGAAGVLPGGIAVWDGGAPSIGYRMSYSKWSTTANINEVDLANVTSDRSTRWFPYDGGDGVGDYGYSWPDPGDGFVFTNCMQLRNDGDRPVLFAVFEQPSPACPGGFSCPGPDGDGNPFLDYNPQGSAEAVTLIPAAAPSYPLVAYDLSVGTLDAAQETLIGLLPTADELGAAQVMNVAASWQEGFNPLGPNVGFFGPAVPSAFLSVSQRYLEPSVPYDDPLPGGGDVYLVWLGLSDPDLEGGAGIILRIPTDLSSTFDYLDGRRFVNYSILAFRGGDGPQLPSTASFVSDHRDVWSPAYYLDRICRGYWAAADFVDGDGLLPGADCDGLYLDGNRNGGIDNISYISTFPDDGDGHWGIATNAICRGCHACCVGGIFFWDRL